MMSRGHAIYAGAGAGLAAGRTVLGSEGEGEGDEEEDEDCEQEIRCERALVVVLRHGQRRGREWVQRMGPNYATPRRERMSGPDS